MKISIPQPCSEDWSKMTPTEQGAFCKKCALEVTDFTNKSALEIKSILSEKIQSKQRVCGHIENRQMIEFNNEFIPWKSDQESFRAIWMFSLIAVFGMSLFSCQSTFSKEVVEKMKTSSEVLIEDEKDTLDIAALSDSIVEYNGLDSLAVTSTPWELPHDITGGPVITNGGIGWEVGPPFEIETIICSPSLLGDLIMSGYMLTEPIVIDEEEHAIFQRAFIFNDPSPAPAPSPKLPFPNANERNQQNNQILETKLENGKPEFSAYISPNPVESTSRLFVTIPEEGTLKLTLWELNGFSKTHAETFELVFGNHVIDINFGDFPEGKYAAQLIWEEEKLVVPFEVLNKMLG